MLRTLRIKNYALIDDIEVEFESGLNILTGETGAGKTIIIDALNLVLGERASSEEVRSGTEKSVVEGVFSVAAYKRLKSLIESHQIDWNEDLILRREVSSKGQSRCFINDTPATVNLLNEVGNLLVDLHGQHEHQSLLRVETHISLLDDFGGLDGLVGEFREGHETLKNLFAELRALREQEHRLKKEKELYEFQIREIDGLSPQPGEEQELESELKILENAEKLYEATSRLYEMLYEGDQSVHDQLVLVRNQLEDLESIDKSFEEMKEECTSAEAVVGEVAKFLQQYNSRVEFNPERLEQIRERLGQLTLLKKKYGGTIESIVEHRRTIGREVSLAENFEGEIQKRLQQIAAVRKVASEIAQRLSTKRREVARRVSKAVAEALSELGISSAQFDVNIENRKASGDGDAFVKLGRDFFETTPRGVDFVEFFVSTNPGENVRPLVKVASGGEVSRVMLALKSILAKAERLPLLVFDEIDIGVSGRVAQAVGLSLKNLSNFHQIIAITHLPQIASIAETHFVVEKVRDGKRATTRIRKLTLGERVHEVAKLMSGEEVTAAGLKGARELMKLSD